MQSEWIAHQLGVLTTMVSEGQQANREGRWALHRRIDDTRRELLVHIHRLDRRGAGATSPWRVPYAKIATLLLLIILGAFGHAAPEAVRASLAAMIPSIVKVLISG